MLHIVEGACQFTADRSRGVVVVESDRDGPPFNESFFELEASDARQYAIGYAQVMGVTPPRINGNTQGPYPVNSEGLALDQVRGDNGQPLPPQHPRMQPKRYRIDVPVCSALR